ncbi:hypothetical protein QFZ24_006320 [Streptomyces phaeochromogenes]|uniref:hypothetical protein n=1 Tax=Streptomyces phaeochromogenes TaxID=1923 RepID=UPI0027917A90|nr:hypothetical protein [Streptomyces phaeochromogenes]MDQ0952397.1 hypothetical protein [Streptomyces phaeochromogenes]
MRALPARRIAAPALCATLLLGIAGPAAVAADHDSTRDARSIAAEAPVPGADALLAQVKSLGDVGGVLTPVTDLLNAVLKADNGQLPAADAAKLADAVKAAIAKASAAAPAAGAVTPPVKAERDQAVPTAPPTPAAPTMPAVPTALAKPATPDSATSPVVPSAPATPATPAKPAVPATPVTPVTPVAPPAALPEVPKLPAAPALPLPKDAERAVAEVPLDLKADALKALQAAVDSLVKAATSGDVAGVAAAALAVVTGLVNVVVATVLGGGLPAANLPGLPKLPLPTGALPLPTGGLLPS